MKAASDVANAAGCASEIYAEIARLSIIQRGNCAIVTKESVDLDMPV